MTAALRDEFGYAGVSCRSGPGWRGGDGLLSSLPGMGTTLGAEFPAGTGGETDAFGTADIIAFRCERVGLSGTDGMADGLRRGPQIGLKPGFQPRGRVVPADRGAGGVTRR